MRGKAGMGQGGKQEVVDTGSGRKAQGLIAVVGEGVAENGPDLWGQGWRAGIGQSMGQGVPAGIVQVGLWAEGEDGLQWDMGAGAQGANSTHGRADTECALCRASGGEGGVEDFRESGIKAPAAAGIHEEKRAAVAGAGRGDEFGGGGLIGVVADAGEGEDEVIAGAISDSNTPRWGVDQGA